MPIFEWKEEFIDRRKCAVDADTIEEAIKKRGEGDWLYEETYDFSSNRIITEMVVVEG